MSTASDGVCLLTDRFYLYVTQASRGVYAYVMV